MLRIFQILGGVVAIIIAASIYAITPSIYAADSWTKERVSTVVFGGFLAIGVTSLFLGVFPSSRGRRRKG